MTRTRPARRRRWHASSILASVLAFALLATLGWLGWLLVGTNVTAHRTADRSISDLTSRWSSSSTASEATIPQTGRAFALIRIPALGDDWQWPLLAGTSRSTLAHGLGWYDTTARPGQVGNFAVAGQRISHGRPFADLAQLNKGEVVIVETRDQTLTYQLDSSAADLTVDADAGWVLDPVPGRPAQQPTEALITLTTEQDLFWSDDRSVAFGHLVDTQEK